MLVLEEIFKNKKPENSDYFNLRIHRGLSWLKKAIQLGDDLDLKFIALWISFNSIYARDSDLIQDKQTFREFVYKICQADDEHKIYNIIWEKFSHTVRLLLDNPYIFQAFWDYQNEKISQSAWKEDFEKEKQKVHATLQNKDTVQILMILLNRLYTLRNQLVHGGATYRSSVNRAQLTDACSLLMALMPVFICLLIENSADLDLGKPFYPVVQVS